MSDSDLEADWPAQEPTPGFADRVADAARREASVAPRWPFIAAGAVAALAAGVLLVVWTRGASESSGDARADRERREVSIGTRGVAVLEPGAHIAWSGDTVVQDAGDVFYRVERGAAFEVHTPMANAVVLGTCFRITVDKEQEMKRRDFGAGALGAIAATVVVIGVYEGKVQVSHGKESVTVPAGESATADAHGVRPGATTKVVVAARSDDGSKTAADLRTRLSELEQEKASLEQQLATAHENDGKNPYDLTPDDWAKLAEQGAFKYQLPCFREGGYRPTQEQLDKLGLTAKDADTIQQAYRHANQQFGRTMREICAADPGADISACISKMFTNLYTKGADSARDAYVQVDEIRAGKRPEPKPDQTTPELRMLLLFSNGMTGFEGELAQTFGADEAHRIAYSDDLCYQANTFR